ncbi:MAG: SDR family NAD(P)-dependent oxidoreductase, partial [Phycisphaerales bacterium]
QLHAVCGGAADGLHGLGDRVRGYHHALETDDEPGGGTRSLGHRGGIADLDIEGLARDLRINAVGPLRVIKHLLPNLRAAPTRKIVSISSQLGSITNANGGSSYGYRASKAALNMLNKHLSIELAEEGFTCMVLHPGWVKTRMGGEEAPLTPPESIAGMLKVIANAEPKTHNGAFLDYKGDTLPW